VAVASAGPYASLHLAPDRLGYNHANTQPLTFLEAGCPSWRPTNNIKALKIRLKIYRRTDLTRSPAAPIGLVSASVPINIGESVTEAERVIAAAIAVSAITPV